VAKVCKTCKNAPTIGAHSPYCETCRVAARRTAQAKYLAEHPERRKESTAKYRVANRDTERERYLANAEAIKLRSRQYYEHNREQCLSKMKSRIARDPQRALDRVSAWRRDNPEKYRLQYQRIWNRRRARLRDGDSPGVTSAEWLALLARHHNRCAYCGSTKQLTRDHVHPISRGGRDEPANVVPACLSCNSSKGAKTVAEWLGASRADDRRTNPTPEGLLEGD
jgi:5-methylcytosine-specific restriction endonuclease McrA